VFQLASFVVADVVDHSSMSYVINGCYNPYLAEILMLGSIFKHLLKKSRKFLLLHFILEGQGLRKALAFVIK